MDVRKLLKVYNYVNDEKRSRVNLKFAGALLAFLVAGAALVGFALLQRGSSPVAETPAASQTDYVGLSTEEIQAGSLGESTVEERWRAWQSEHPDAVIEEREEVRMGPLLVGYRVTYHEP